MAKVRIDMPEFERYIKLMNRIVNDICESNRVFAGKIMELEDVWRDDVYKEARNQMFRMQSPTNDFISTLETLDEELIKWYCELYEEYYKTTAYSRPVIDMGRVERINDEVRKDDNIVEVSLETLEGYVQSTYNYTTATKDLIDELFQAHHTFAEYFQSRRYEEITDALQQPRNAIFEILTDMEALADFVKSKIDIIRKY